MTIEHGSDDGSAIRRPRTRLPADRRRGEILSASAALFRSRGYAAVGMDAIGAAAGISGPAIYRHFSGKHEILLALLGEAVDQAVAAIGELTENDSVEALAETLVRHATDGRLLVALLQDFALPAGSSGRQKLGRLRAKLVARTSRLLRQVRPDLSARDTRMRIDAAVAIVRGIAAHALLTDADRRAFERMVAAVLNA